MGHEQKVKSIVEQIRQFEKHGHPIKIKKDEVSHFVPNPYDKRHKLRKVDLTSLNELLKIDAEARTCTAEPGISFSKIVEETLKHGLAPYTVPELKGITLGGAVSGCSIESMSYKYGGFHDSCIEYEVVTGTGEILTCSDKDNPDIFHMLHGSYGTLGIITKIKFKLIDVKPFVKMQYVRHDNFAEFWNFMKERCERRDCDFIDGIIHSKDKFVTCIGNMTDSAPRTSSYDWLNIYYKSTAKKIEDHLNIYDYFFRYDAECHWLTKTVPLMETKPARLLLGKAVLGSTNLIKWSNRLKPIMKMKRRPEVVVDVFIPHKRFEEFYSWYEKEYDFYPLWIVPYKAPNMYPWISSEYAKGMDGSFFIDCAVYGKRNSDPKKDYSEILERKTIELNGIKTLISRNHFDKKTFWNIYNLKKYNDVKKKTDPHNLFNDMYTKFHPTQYK